MTGRGRLRPGTRRNGRHDLVVAEALSLQALTATLGTSDLEFADLQHPGDLPAPEDRHAHRAQASTDPDLSVHHPDAAPGTARAAGFLPRHSTVGGLWGYRWLRNARSPVLRAPPRRRLSCCPPQTECGRPPTPRRAA